MRFSTRLVAALTISGVMVVTTQTGSAMAAKATAKKRTKTTKAPKRTTLPQPSVAVQVAATATPAPAAASNPKQANPKQANPKQANGTESFRLTLFDAAWEGTEKPGLEIAWESYGPKLERIEIVATSSLGDAPVRVSAPIDKSIVVAGLNPYANITIAASPIWSGYGVGAPTTLQVAAGYVGPRPKVFHPPALANVKLIGERPNPCATIRWRYNPERQLVDALPQVTEAMQSIAAATGIDIVFDGITAEYENPESEYDLQTVDARHPRRFMLVQWEDPGKPVRMPNEPDKVLLGYGSAGYRRGLPGLPEDFADGGSVTLRAASSLRDPLLLKSTLLHELGHAVGLDHTEDPTSIMYPYSKGVTDWNAADRAALAALGRPGAEDCVG